MPQKPRYKAYTRQHFRDWLPKWEASTANFHALPLYKETHGYLLAHLKKVNQLLFRTEDDAVALEIAVSTHAERLENTLKPDLGATLNGEYPGYAILLANGNWEQVEALLDRYELSKVAGAFATYWAARCCTDLADFIIARYDMDTPETAPEQLSWTKDTRSLVQLLLELSHYGYLSLPDNTVDATRAIAASFTLNGNKLRDESLRKYLARKPTPLVESDPERLKAEYPEAFKGHKGYFFPKATNQKKRI